MALPTLEDIAVELTRVIQLQLGANADVFFSDSGTAIEVTTAAGDPVVEVQDKPKVQISGPITTPKSSEFQAGADAQERVMLTVDTNALTYTDAPAPRIYDPTYQLTAWATRELSIAGGPKGIAWLQSQLLPFVEKLRLLGAGWNLDEVSGKGYVVEWVTPPGRVPGSSSSLHVISATLVVRRVRLVSGPYSGGPVTGTVNLAVIDGPAP